MAKVSVKAKADLARRITDLLGVNGNDIEELTENLNKMSKTALAMLLEYLEDGTDMEESKPATPPRVPAAFPKHFMPHDVGTPRNPGEMNGLLSMLPEIGRTIFKSFMEADFPELKRAIGVNNRITYGCEKLVAQQLWEAIKVYPQNEEKEE